MTSGPGAGPESRRRGTVRGLADRLKAVQTMRTALCCAAAAIVLAACSGSGDDGDGDVGDVGTDETVPGAQTTEADTEAESGTPTVESGTGAVGDPGVEPNAEAVAVESDDGVVGMVVPPGFVPEGTEVTIDVAEDTAGGGGRLIGSAYVVRPEGLRAPRGIEVSFTQTLDPSAPRTEISVPVATVEGLDGQPQTLFDQRTIVTDRSTAVHLGFLDRFGRMDVLDSGLAVSVDRAGGVEVGESVELTYEVSTGPAIAADSFEIEMRWVVDGSTEEAEIVPSGPFPTPDESTFTTTQQLECTVAGSIGYTTETRIVDPSGVAQFVVVSDELLCGDVGR